MSWADKPEGPWYKHNEPILTTEKPGKFKNDSSKDPILNFMILIVIKVNT